MIPRNRLRWIPYACRDAHCYAYFLHDQCAHLLCEYEATEAHLVTFSFADNAEQERFERLAAEGDPVTALRQVGRETEARRVALNAITMAMVSDSLHHFFEALKCLEKRKSVVALNLLRKPLLDSLIYLSWMLGDEDDFYGEFAKGDPERLKPSLLGNRREAIFNAAIAKCDLAGLVTAGYLQEVLFDAASPIGLYRPLQHAVHLVTVQREAVRTAAQNFNFIFKNPLDDDVYAGIYYVLPALLLYFAHVVLGLFERIKPMDEGSRKAAVYRSLLGYQLVAPDGNSSITLEILRDTLTPHLTCERCDTRLKVTQHNAMRLVIMDSWRCSKCRAISDFPFAWIF